MTIRSTYTYAVLDVSSDAYGEIRGKLLEAGYQHALHQDGGREVIDMHGIALARSSGPDQPAIRDVAGAGWQPIETAPRDGTWIMGYTMQYGREYLSRVRFEKLEDGTEYWVGESFISRPFASWTSCPQPTLWQPFVWPNEERGATGFSERVIVMYSRGPGDPPGNTVVCRCHYCGRTELEGHGADCRCAQRPDQPLTTPHHVQADVLLTFVYLLMRDVAPVASVRDALVEATSIVVANRRPQNGPLLELARAAINSADIEGMPRVTEFR